MGDSKPEGPDDLNRRLAEMAEADEAHLALELARPIHDSTRVPNSLASCRRV